MVQYFHGTFKKLILCSCSWAKSKCFVIKILDHSIFFILPMDCLYFPHGSSLFSSRIVFILPTDRLYFPMDRLYSPHRQSLFFSHIVFILPTDRLYSPHGQSLFSPRIVFILPTDTSDSLYSSHGSSSFFSRIVFILLTDRLFLPSFCVSLYKLQLPCSLNKKTSCNIKYKNFEIWPELSTF